MWQFWIDVGGTFTDCLGLSPDGQEIHTKVLSSGLFKGSIDDRTADSFSSSFLVRSGGVNFWESATLRLIDLEGEIIGESCVRKFDDNSGRIWIDPHHQSTLSSAVNFELDLNVHAPILAVRKILQLPVMQPLPACRIHLGTTKGTNALLTRSGARTAFVTTKGFRDLLTIGDQARPHLFELSIKKPEPLFDRSIEIEERILADGVIELSPAEDLVRTQLEQLRQNGIESIAICLMHGYRYPSHEKIVGEIAREIGFRDVRLSSEVAPLIKIVPRAETTVLDAYLNPVIGEYLDEIESQLSEGSQLRLMSSTGGLISRDRFSGKDSVLSGPAGGVVGAARIAEQAGFVRMIGFDMGGTSSDVSRYDGEFEREFETQKAGVRIVMPMMAVETVAAGGGSVCRFDGTKLVVGPESAGADPGPACYGRGGPLAITDINLTLGRIRPSHFPFPLNESAAIQRLEAIAKELEASTGKKYSAIELAEGFFKIANHNMAAAIRSVSVAKGYDPRDYVLVSFGGAGSQHCCSVARNLGMTRILDHPQGSILSAVGIRLADQTSHAVSSVLREFADDSPEFLEPIFESLVSKTVANLISEGCSPESITSHRSLDMRYQGTDSFLTVPEPECGDYVRDFNALHHRLYGYTQDRLIEIVAARVESKSTTEKNRPIEFPATVRSKPPTQTQPGRFEGVSIETGLFDRHELQTGDQVVGPAIISSPFSTTIIDPGWHGTLLSDGQILLQSDSEEQPSPTNEKAQEGDLPDPIRLEIFNNHFSSIARQMGISLQRTSVSVNVKERLDFSCAIFNANGDLVVNAPHIPVHLGAMSETVREIIRRNDVINPGEVFVTNDPYAGGSHLPDITVASPVFGDQASPMFWVASRSHHAEIGGMAPGSMPANATKLGQEGVLISNFKLIEAGVERFDELREVLTSGPYPSRSPDENLADLRAQLAANRRGEHELLQLVSQHGRETVQKFMGYIQNAAESKARSALRKWRDGTYEFADSMDDGGTIRLSINKKADSIKLDFGGTDDVRPGNLNANRAIVSAAVMYVMRCVIDEDIPLNEGVMKPVEICLPECFLNPGAAENPAESPAVVGGNVETSQRIVDVILGAMGLAAASCGTMNNWLIGDASFGYYETVGGGSGATPDRQGTDAVHTHMTNTRLTDPEILESRFPVVLREFSIRAESGGEGRHRGGNGMHREVEFTRSLTLSLLTNRRSSRPFGLSGGQAGASGKNLLVKDGESQLCPSQCQIQVAKGDRLVLLTPGGGGYGEA